MERKDRSQYRVRKFRLGDREQEYEPSWSIHPDKTTCKPHDQRLPRNVLPVTKYK